MFFTVIMLISNIEQTFNNIWQIKKQRSVFRTITDYTSMFLLVPITIVITSGVSIFFATIFKQIENTMLIGPLTQFILQLMPYVLMSGVFIALYVFMPNTKVKLTCAIAPGILAGVAMQGLQIFYIHSQIWVSSYNAIYGSLQPCRCLCFGYKYRGLSVCSVPNCAMLLRIWKTSLSALKPRTFAIATRHCYA